MSTFGIDWTAEQNSIVVEAYFDMLLQQQDGTRYVKAEYNRNVQSRTGKTRGSVEWKFQNISFLLQEMGHPTITGYKPRSNAQRGTLYDAISRHLQANQYPHYSPRLKMMPICGELSIPKVSRTLGQKLMVGLF